MDSKRELVRRLIAGENVGRCGLWLGKPHPLAWPLLHDYFKTATEEEWRQKLGDDCRWIAPHDFMQEIYHDPSGRGMFDVGLDRETFGSIGPLAACETIAEVEDYPWPNPDYLNLEPLLHALRQTGDTYRLSGFWTCFFHNASGLFGMEEYLVKMYTNPEVVHAVTDKICQFYLEANERLFTAAGAEIDGFFLGNDFGSQQSLICSPALFDEYIMPWFAKFTAQGHRHGKQVVLHSCGAIHPVIERLISSGVDCLHPLQALAKDMDADTLARDFRGRITFMGGIDMQALLTSGTPAEVRADVRRVKKLLGQNLIISPSHEAILPNVPPANIEALAQAAAE